MHNMGDAMSLSQSHHVVSGGRRVVLRDHNQIGEKKVRPGERDLIDRFIARNEVRYETGAFETLVIRGYEEQNRPAKIGREKTGRSYIIFANGKTKSIRDAVVEVNAYRAKMGRPELRLP